MRRFLPIALLLAMTMAIPAPSFAQTALPPAPYANRQLDDPALEAKATDLMHTIRCLTCQSQSIADSDASMAADMRSEIRERIARGEDPEAIRAWLIERYGDWISYKPTAEPILWPLWAAPILMLGAGGLLVRSRMKRRRGSQP
ncbi:cytochrome c-type biogenesis protein CcmH [Sphingobium sp. SYK-6]|uniref:cytochrome c-type biogenesis protein n=1 Tax=Sphingobium sp. (strain NBRC 103272 / SYK-6) TaxID=627192 RepID=UPI0002276FE3|nr:cytochrome c-type biogenesis protein [Sphingobium sp. SYK-6]BAK66291.1 cytochrome c-type biogenesis protein CcmH [Sphingobium sp. SYK-6]